MKSENREFIALFESSGWNQAEVSRRLHTTRATISRYLSGEIVPARAVVELFKMVLAHDNPAALAAATQAGQREKLRQDDVHEKLQELKEKDPAAYQQAKGNIEFLHDRVSSALPRTAKETTYKPGKKAKVSSKTEEENVYGAALRIFQAAKKAVAAENEPPAPEQPPASGESSASNEPPHPKPPAKKHP